MKTIHRFVSLAACLPWWAAAGAAQPLAKPLADFDRMVSELKTAGIVGEPIHVGETTIVPFAAVHFGLGSVGAAGIAAGGLGAKTVPLGVLIVEGDNVRVELLPKQEEKPGAIQQLVQAVLDRKLTYMVNGINLGTAPGNFSDLSAMMNGMMGQTNLMVNGLNLGQLNPPRAQTAGTNKPVADFEAAVAASPTAENYYLLGEALRRGGRKDQAAAAYRKAIELRPGYPEATKALAGMEK